MNQIEKIKQDHPNFKKENQEKIKKLTKARMQLHSQLADLYDQQATLEDKRAREISLFVMAPLDLAIVLSIVIAVVCSIFINFVISVPIIMGINCLALLNSIVMDAMIAKKYKKKFYNHSLKKDKVEREIDQITQERSVRNVLDKMLEEKNISSQQTISTALAILKSIPNYELSFDEETSTIIQQVTSFLEETKQKQEELVQYVYQLNNEELTQASSELKEKRLSFTRNGE